MENDFMNELEDFMAGQTPPPPQPSAGHSVQSPAMKNVKDVLGERLRTQMQGEKRKLEDNSASDILSKTQKMDNDLHHDNEHELQQQPTNGPQRLLAQALMDKQPRASNTAGSMMAIKSPSPKEQRGNEELTALLNDYPNMVASRGPTAAGPKMQRMPSNPGNRMMNNDMMPMDNSNGGNFYGMQQQPRLPMPQQHHPQQRPPMNNWNGMDPRMYNVPPQKMNMAGPRGGPGAANFPDGTGPPPNAWVGPNGGGPNKVMMNGPPQGSPYYNSNGCQRTPMMRPNGINNYNDYNNGSPQMYGGNVRNYGMNSPGNDPYANPHRFGSPNGRVCQPGYSPNNHGPVENMHAVRSSANFHNDSNAGYNGYNGGQNDYLPPPNVLHQGYNRPRPNFMPNGNGMVYNSNGRIGMPQSSPMCHNGNGMEMQNMQAFQHHNNSNHHQQQQFMDQQQFNNNDTNFNPSDFNMPNGGMMESNNDWRHQALSIRQSLLNKLKEALTSANFPNAQSMAESYEKEAFMSAESLKDYQYKLVQWLASIYDSSSHSSAAGSSNENKADSSSPPDSSTNGLNDVTTSSCDQTGDTSLIDKPLLGNDDLMLATPKSEGCLSPSSPLTSSSSVNSPLSCSNVMTTASATTATTTTSSGSASPSTSISGGTFQAPATVTSMPATNVDIESKTSSPTLMTATTPVSSVTSTTSKVTTVGSTQRRVSGSSGGAVTTLGVQSNTVATAVPPMSSIGNNPQSVDSGIGLGSPRSITSASSTTLYSPKIQGTSPSLLPGSDNSPEKANSSS